MEERRVRFKSDYDQTHVCVMIENPSEDSSEVSSDDEKWERVLMDMESGAAEKVFGGKLKLSEKKIYKRDIIHKLFDGTDASVLGLSGHRAIAYLTSRFGQKSSHKHFLQFLNQHLDPEEVSRVIAELGGPKGGQICIIQKDITPSAGKSQSERCKNIEKA